MRVLIVLTAGAILNLIGSTPLRLAAESSAPSSVEDVVSREFSVFRSIPISFDDVISREFTLLRREPVAVTDVVSREFSVDVLQPDLAASDLLMTPNVVTEDDPVATVSWTVTNVGDTGTTVSWIDRVTLSMNSALGDGDDQLLGEFTNPMPLGRLDSYIRTEQFSFPNAAGRYWVFVATNADGAVLEPPGLPQQNNVVSTSFEVVPPLPPPLECITFSQSPGQDFLTGTTVALSGEVTGLGGSISVLYVIDASGSTGGNAGLDCDFDDVLESEDDINGDGFGPIDGVGGSRLDCELGASLLLDKFIEPRNGVIHASVVFGSGASRLDIAPAAGWQAWMTPFERDDDGNAISDFEEAMRSVYTLHPPGCFGNCAAGAYEHTPFDFGTATNIHAAVTEGTGLVSAADSLVDRHLVVLLTDGNEGDTTFPPDELLEELATYGVDFRLFVIGSSTITPSFQNMADVLDAAPDSTGVARAVVEANDLLFELLQSISLVELTVNGVPADSIDTAGRFFHVVTIKPGQNCFDVQAMDASGGTCSNTICFEGVDQPGGNVDQYSDVTASIGVEYFGTTVNHQAQTLVTQAKAQNTGADAVDGPVLMVVDSITDPSVTITNADGMTDDGKPYFVFVDLTADPTLDPGEYSQARPLVFNNPNNVRVVFTTSWLALGNTAPVFTTVPPILAAVAVPYQYDAHALDAENQSLTFTLEAAPSGMTVESATGVVSWTPDGSQVGSNNIVLVVTDNRGGRAEQHFSIDVASEFVNRPPLFTSSPVTHVSVGVPYEYQATATDPDAQPLVFSKTEGPAELIVQADGLVSWDVALPGEHTIQLEVSDGNGGTATQSYVLTVGDQPTNPHAPVLFGTPSAIAAVESLYVYQLSAFDPDPFDEILFSIPAVPAGMNINPRTGRVTWIPDATQIGLHGVTVVAEDGNGGAASQSWSIEVFQQAPNQPPVVESVPNFIATVGQPYEYQVKALDPDGINVTCDLFSPPTGMTIDPDTCLISWLPDTAGMYTVAVQVFDVVGAIGTQVFVLDVAAVNDPPTIVSTPVESGIEGGAYRYDVNATDPNFDVIDYFLIQGPAEMTINQLTGLIVWTPGAGAEGEHPVAVRALDRRGAFDEQSFTIAIVADVVPPTVQIVFIPPAGNIGETVMVCVQAGDNAGIANRTLAAAGEAINLDVAGCGSYTPDAIGLVLFEATASDHAGNLGTAQSNLQVTDPSDTNPPTISNITPPPASTLTGFREITATITDDTPELLTWQVEMARAETEEYEVVGSGTGDVDGVIGNIDATVLQNDSYKIRITASDGNNPIQLAFTYGISGEFKLGNFTMTFTDLSIPVAGIPLVITRTYDSLDTSIGDLGAGWRLGLPGAVRDTTTEVTSGNPNSDQMSSAPYRADTRVYVTKPDGRRVGFRFQPEPVGGVFAFLFKPVFAPDAGVTDTLEAPSAPSQVWLIDGSFYDFYIPYNPRQFVLTTKEGLKYTIDEFDGLQQIEDVNGNTIDVTPDGLVSSLGVAITFVRDGQGRITDILEPDPQAPSQLQLARAAAICEKARKYKRRIVRDRSGIRRAEAVSTTENRESGSCAGVLHYDYDASGNLVAFTDQTCNTTQYFYEDLKHPNYLTRIEDPENRPVVRSVFDEDGRLIGICDANGDPATLEGCTEFATDSVGGTATVINARGCRTDLQFDDRGNVLTETRWLDNDGDNDCTTGGLGDPLTTTRTYDADNNLLSETSPPTPEAAQGYTWTFTYDDRRNQLTREDPGGRTWTSTFNQCNKVTSETDPMGNVTTYQYDEFCNLRFVMDALGGVTEYRYSAEGQRTHFIDAVGNTWEFYYDANGLPSGFIDPLGHTATMQFKAAGELEFSIDRRGWRIDFDYDDAHRVILERWQPNVGAPEPGDLADPRDTTYTYNAAGQILTAVDPDSALTMDYYPTGLLQYVDNAGTPGAPQVRIDYGYDPNGNVTSVTDSLGGITEYQYDSLDRNARIVQYGTDVNEKRVDLEYDDANALRVLRRFADLTGTQGVANTFYEYDCGACPSRLSAIHHRKASDNSVIHDLDYVRDALGNILEMTDAEGLHTYTYDGLRRLLTADHPDGGPQPDEFYTYDPVGNRLSSHLSGNYSYSYQPPFNEGGNQLRQDDQYDYEYDNNGNLIEQLDRTTGDYAIFAYDHRNRMTALNISPSKGGSLSGGYTYDGTNRRIRRTSNTTVINVAYDAQNIILELSDDSSITRLLPGRRVDATLCHEASAQTRWHLTDQVRSVRDELSPTGLVEHHYVYDSFGRLMAQSGTASVNTLSFTSRPFDETIGYFRSRYYIARIGRFMAADPLYPFGYEYGRNNPLAFTDPSGTAPSLIQFVVKGAMIVGPITAIKGLQGVAVDCPGLNTTGDQAASFAVGFITGSAVGAGAGAIAFGGVLALDLSFSYAAFGPGRTAGASGLILAIFGNLHELTPQFVEDATCEFLGANFPGFGTQGN